MVLERVGRTGWCQVRLCKYQMTWISELWASGLLWELYGCYAYCQVCHFFCNRITSSLTCLWLHSRHLHNLNPHISKWLKSRANPTSFIPIVPEIRRLTPAPRLLQVRGGHKASNLRQPQSLCRREGFHLDCGLRPCGRWQSTSQLQFEGLRWRRFAAETERLDRSICDGLRQRS